MLDDAVGRVVVAVDPRLEIGLTQPRSQHVLRSLGKHHTEESRSRVIRHAHFPGLGQVLQRVLVSRHDVGGLHPWNVLEIVGLGKACELAKETLSSLSTTSVSGIENGLPKAWVDPFGPWREQVIPVSTFLQSKEPTGLVRVVRVR